VSRTQSTLDALIQALQGNCGDLFDACQKVLVSPVFVRQWMKDDKDVAAQIQEAERVGALALQSEAIRRAVHGVEKGVYFKGFRVDTETVYSDGLLQTLLKGRMAETFGAEEQRGNTFNGPTQINIVPRADTYEDWLRMKDATLHRRDTMDKTDANLLPAPQSDIIDITPVSPAAQAAYALMAPPSPFEGLGL
jgi:hypothetical protein